MLGITNVSNAPSVVLKDTVISTWAALPTTSGQTDYDMYQQGYVYYASIPAVGVTVNTLAEITFSDAQAKSGNYAPMCRTFTDAVRIYSKVNTSITVPSIIIHSIVENYYSVDINPPTSGKTTAISSGAVYDALGSLQNKLVITFKEHSTTIPTGYFKDTDLSVNITPGTYLIETGMIYSTGSIGDRAAVCGFYDSVDIWIQNNYPSGLTNDTNRVNGTHIAIYSGNVTISPIFYRLTSDSATTGTTYMRIIKIA